MTLVWKNFYYGSYKKKDIKNFKAFSWSANPSYVFNPEVLKILNDKIKGLEVAYKNFQNE